MITIAIPVHNEQAILESSIRTIHEHLSEQQINHEIIVVSNGSTDNTCEIGNKLAAAYSWFKFFKLDNKGVGAAFVKAVNESSGKYVICIDADLSVELTFIDYSCTLLNHCDMLVGSKIMGNQYRSWTRVIASQIYIFFTQICFGLTISDYSIGAKSFRRSSIVDALPYLDNWTGYVFELCLYLKLHQKRIVQIGIDCNDNRKSKFNLLHEGIYRYAHLIKCRAKLKDSTSWLYKDGQTYLSKRD